MHPFFKRSAVTFLLAAVSAGAFAATPPTTTPPTEAIAFVTAAAQAGKMEVEAANHALQTSGSEAVKTFARQMIADHGRIHADLLAVAKPKEIPVPETLSAEQGKMLAQLRAKTGAAFDAAYIAQMVGDHVKAVELFQANVTTPDSELSAFAGKTLPVLLEHRRLAENLSANAKASR